MFLFNFWCAIHAVELILSASHPAVHFGGCVTDPLVLPAAPMPHISVSIQFLVCHSCGGTDFECQSFGGFFGVCVTDQLVLPAAPRPHNIEFYCFVNAI